MLCRPKLAILGLKEALAPQGEGFRCGRTEAARDVARRRAPVDGTYLLLQGVDQPFAVVVHVELALPRAGLLPRGGEERQVQRNVICNIPGKVEPITVLEIGTQEKGMNIERALLRMYRVQTRVIGGKRGDARGPHGPRWRY